MPSSQRPTKKIDEDFTHYVWCEVRGFVFMFPADVEPIKKKDLTDVAREEYESQRAQEQAEAAFGDMGFEDEPEVIWVERRPKS